MLTAVNLRRTGWLLAISGISSTAVFIVFSAWRARNSTGAFNLSVGWANVISMLISAVGVVLLLAERVGAFTDPTPQSIAGIADKIANEAKRQDGLLLAQLLSTDTLDSRAASGTFQLQKNAGRQKPKNKTYKPIIKEFPEIVKFFLDETLGRMVILGGPGTGKTVLAVSLTVGLLDRRSDASLNQEKVAPVPCLFNLPSWDVTRQDLTDWLEVEISSRFRLPRRYAAQLVSDGWIMPVLDGLDELDSQDTEVHRSLKAVSLINRYIARTPNCRIVIVCRSGEKYYDRLAGGVRNADKIIVQRLTPAQIIDYIEIQFPAESAMATWRPVLDALTSSNSSSVYSELNTPWRLTAAATFALSGGDPSSLLPSRDESGRPGKRTEYSKRISSLLMHTFLTARILNYGHRNAAPASIIRKLVTIVHLLDGLESPHRAGKEIILHQWWLAFSKLKVLRAQMILMFIILHIPGIEIYIYWNSHFGKPHRGTFDAVAVFTNYITIMLFCSNRISTAKEPLMLRIRSLRSRIRVISVLTGLIISGAGGWAAATAYGLWNGIGTGVSMAALATLIFASVGVDPPESTHPMAVLVNDRNISFVIGVAVGSYATMYYVTLYGLSVALALASMCIAGSFLTSLYARYLAAAYLGRRQGLPLRFSHFLNQCQSSGILRISGIGYQFRHQELFEYLRAQETLTR